MFSWNDFIPESDRSFLKFPPYHYEMIHKKWQYHLSKMLRQMVPTDEMKSLIDRWYKKYQKGFVAYVTKGRVPERCSGLAKYLANVASPPIAVSRIDGKYMNPRIMLRL